MLNEFLEFDEYTVDPSTLISKASKKVTDKTVGRLRVGNICAWEERDGILKGKYTGIRRVLLIISRHAYFEKKLSVEAINHLLNCYCFGGEMKMYDLDKIDEYKYINGWLIEYLDIFKEADKPSIKATEYEDINNEILGLINKKGDRQQSETNYNYRVELIKSELREKKSEYWNNSIVNKNGSVNDADTIYFDGIIADAINKGPLNKCYLAFEKKPLICYTGLKNALDDRALKLVAAYLLEREAENSTVAFVNFADYSNWVKEGCADSKKVTKRVIPGITYSNMTESQIFQADFIVKVAKTKLYPYLKLDEEWIREYKPRIIPNEDLEKALAAKLYVYEDLGCNKSLRLMK